jgi:hypothetical protein
MDRQASAEHPKMTDDPRPDEKAAEPDTPTRRYADTHSLFRILYCASASSGTPCIP